jgi:hypothetical protein
MAGLHCDRCWEANLQENIQEAPFHIYTFLFSPEFFFVLASFNLLTICIFINFLGIKRFLFWHGSGSVFRCTEGEKSLEEGDEKEKRFILKKSTYWELGRVRLFKQILCANAMGI